MPPLHVLVVEDNPPDARLVQEMLREAAPRYRCEIAPTLAEALSCLATAMPHVIMLDLGLPDSQGLDTLRRLRHAAPQVPVIVLSGLADDDVVMAAAAEGAQDYLVKGRLEHDLLVRAIRYAIERMKAAAALQASEERLRQIADNITQVFFLYDIRPAFRCVYVSPAYERVYGRPVGEVLDDPLAWIAAAHPDDQDYLREIAQRTSLPPEGAMSVFRVLRPDGVQRWVRSRVFPIQAPDGSMERVVGVADDITELRETERLLLHAQKMEAVGHLAGGVAHDFNNLLTVIQSYAEVLKAEAPAAGQRTGDLDEIMASVQRAQNLTRQLLAFSRQQVMQPAVLAINDVVQGVQKMLLRLIGEDVMLDLRLASDAGRVRADPGQLEQVLINLAVNARDAMPMGGRLTIATATASLGADQARVLDLPREGRYTVVSVADTGCGMTPDVAAHIFEPFFTTKDAAHGTGLGLATVYGVLKQSGGNVTVRTEPGAGSVFDIYLPQVAAADQQPALTTDGALLLGTETVLVAEDDPGVARATRRILERCGYRVISASNGEQALRAAEQDGDRIALLVSDVVMPGMDGPTLVTQLSARYPAIKVLFTSGYAGDAIVRRGVLKSGVPFLEKPFTAAGLSRKVREVLDR